MANVALFRSNQEPQYLKSVNTPDYSSDPDALIDPNITSVQSVPTKFWKRSGNTVSEMSQAEKDVILAAELTARKSAADTFAADPLAIFTALIKVINVRLTAGQKITKAELITAVKEEII